MDEVLAAVGHSAGEAANAPSPGARPSAAAGAFPAPNPLAIALIRQRYAGDGGAERFVARMLDTLKDRARLTLITREWSQAPGFEVLACNPFYIGRWWRDRSFARDVCRLLGSRRFDLVQSHERIACCDIYRAGDGLHREWLKTGRGCWARSRAWDRGAQSVSPLPARRRAAAVRKPAAARGGVQLAPGARRDQTPLSDCPMTDCTSSTAAWTPPPTIRT